MLLSEKTALPYKTIKKREQSIVTVKKLLHRCAHLEIFSQEPTPLVCLTNVGFGGLGGVPQPTVEAFLDNHEGFIKVIMTLGKVFRLLLTYGLGIAFHAPVKRADPFFFHLLKIFFRIFDKAIVQICGSFS